MVAVTVFVPVSIRASWLAPWLATKMEAGETGVAATKSAVASQADRITTVGHDPAPSFRGSPKARTRNLPDTLRPVVGSGFRFAAPE
ncbi:hypothetical protein GCM10007887_35050 [Methylobacterium haplocladii]|uniref:Uncharacterized protein n=1 Tax=Methylobacterium haplocladii TaxID=1176176 RepID=A0A512IU36_9HYPH|nr:hypothetical protein MHA02_36070 [Methylobacterium haplocladii]GLS60817.1 hypothetical protein GCM10007887_35050 [Methylobacterium haplocladii]